MADSHEKARDPLLVGEEKWGRKIKYSDTNGHFGQSITSLYCCGEFGSSIEYVVAFPNLDCVEVESLEGLVDAEEKTIS